MYRLKSALVRTWLLLGCLLMTYGLFAQSVSESCIDNNCTLTWSWGTVDLPIDNVTSATLVYYAPAGKKIQSFSSFDATGWFCEGSEGSDWSVSHTISSSGDQLTVNLTRIQAPISGWGTLGGGIIEIDDVPYKMSHTSLTPYLLQNPSDRLQIVIPTGNEGEFTFQLVNQGGQIVYQRQVEAGKQTIPQSLLLPTGMYYVRFANRPDWPVLTWMHR